VSDRDAGQSGVFVEQFEHILKPMGFDDRLDFFHGAGPVSKVKRRK